MESINVTVREGDSFDELFLAFQKPVGTPHDFSGSEVVAQIKDTFSATQPLLTALASPNCRRLVI